MNNFKNIIVTILFFITGLHAADAGRTGLRSELLGVTKSILLEMIQPYFSHDEASATYAQILRFFTHATEEQLHDVFAALAPSQFSEEALSQEMILSIIISVFGPITLDAAPHEHAAPQGRRVNFSDRLTPYARDRALAIESLEQRRVFSKYLKEHAAPGNQKITNQEVDAAFAFATSGVESPAAAAASTSDFVGDEARSVGWKRDFLAARFLELSDPKISPENFIRVLGHMTDEQITVFFNDTKISSPESFLKYAVARFFENTVWFGSFSAAQDLFAFPGDVEDTLMAVGFSADDEVVVLQCCNYLMHKDTYDHLAGTYVTCPACRTPFKEGESRLDTHQSLEERVAEVCASLSSQFIIRQIQRLNPDQQEAFVTEFNTTVGADDANQKAYDILHGVIYPALE